MSTTEFNSGSDEDRNPRIRRDASPKTGRLKCIFVNVSGQRLEGEPINFTLYDKRNQVCARRNVDGKVLLQVTDIVPGQYRILVMSPARRSVGRFVHISHKGVMLPIVMPIVPSHVQSVIWPPFDGLPIELRASLIASGSTISYNKLNGRVLYDALTSLHKACFLNIGHKLLHTFVHNVCTWQMVHSIFNFSSDRMFFWVLPRFLEGMRSDLDNFHEVSGTLHKSPSDGSDCIASYKTEELYGSLQFSFFSTRDGTGLLCDVDIDDANGILHVFQVLKNALSGKPTHPYNIHEILVKHQGIDPGYIFQV